jgi:hypothetical protein
MGHTRLGALPRTRQWGEVVALIAVGAEAPQIAIATINAAERGLNLASHDEALVESIYLLTQLPLAARSPNFVSKLREAGLNVVDEPGLMDIVSSFSEAVDHQVGIGARSDLGEMAQMAAAETIAKVVGESTSNLFGVGSHEVRHALHKLGTTAQFGDFARLFFTRLANRCMDYYLSRAFSYHLGEGKRFTTLAQQEQFNEALHLHCREASKIVERFSGEWLSKTNWERGGVSREHARGFAHVAMQKLVAELKAGARPNA